MSFDHHSPEFAARWPDIFRELRGSCPVSHSPEHGGFHVLTRYADVQRAARDWKDFSTENDLDGTGKGGRGIQIPANAVRMGMLEMDPPENLDYRRLLLEAFAPAAVTAYEPRLRELVTWCVDQVIEDGACDIVDSLANPVPALVTLDYVGIPLDRAARYGEILHRSVYTLRDTPAFAEVMVGIQWMLGDLAAVVAARRAEPGQDVISHLQRSTINGEPVTDAAVTETLFMILNGGVDTTTGSIAHMLSWLSGHPDDRTRLATDPTAIPAAIEEFLRFTPPALASGRNVVADVELSGTKLVPGDRVLLAWASANRDEEKFPDAETLRLDRAPNPHLSFGHGAHKCIGAALARAELRIVLEQTLRRMPDLAIDSSEAVPYADLGVVNAFSAMPATFTPGAREGSRAPGELPV